MNRTSARSVGVIFAVAIALGVASPVSAVQIVDDGWTWTLAETASDEVILATDAVHPDLAGPGLDVLAWPSTGELGFPRWINAADETVQWGAPLDVSGGAGIPQLAVPSGSSGSVTVDGAVATWNLSISTRSFAGSPLLGWRAPSDAVVSPSTGSDPLQAIGSDLSTTAARAWVAHLGDPGWVFFSVEDSPTEVRGFLFPDDPISINFYGGSYTFTQRLLATAPCAADRSSVLRALADSDVTAPITEQQQVDLLRCAEIAPVTTPGRGESARAVITIPSTITSTGWLDDPEAIGMRVIGLPDGITAGLIVDGSNRLAIEFSGEADPQNVDLDVVLWREVVDQNGLIRVEPISADVSLTLTGAELAATGPLAATELIMLAAIGAALLGAGVVVVVRRRVVRE